MLEPLWKIVDIRQMLLPDVIAIIMTDVNVTIEVDVITSYELFCGRCYCHMYWQML